jgi:hypothetical protein
MKTGPLCPFYYCTPWKRGSCRTRYPACAPCNMPPKTDAPLVWRCSMLRKTTPRQTNNTWTGRRTYNLAYKNTTPPGRVGVRLHASAGGTHRRVPLLGHPHRCMAGRYRPLCMRCVCVCVCKDPPRTAPARGGLCGGGAEPPRGRTASASCSSSPVVSCAPLVLHQRRRAAPAASSAGTSHERERAPGSLSPIAEMPE